MRLTPRTEAAAQQAAKPEYLVTEYTVVMLEPVAPSRNDDETGVGLMIGVVVFLVGMAVLFVIDHIQELLQFLYALFIGGLGVVALFVLIAVTVCLWNWRKGRAAKPAQPS